MKLKRFVFSICVLSLLGTGSVFAEDVEQKIKEAKEVLSGHLSSAAQNILEEFEVILPEANSLSNVQPDAYIGKVFPSLPPHFVVGVNVSVTPVNTGFISENMNTISSAVSSMLEEADAIKNVGEFSFDFSFPDKIPYPAASVSGRVGGLFLPFDVGLWGITTGKIFHDKSIGDSPVFDFDYMAVGVDLRYAVLEGIGLLPKISVGLGYQFARQNLGVSFSREFTIDAGYEDPDGENVSGSADMDSSVNFKVNTHTFFGQIQVSKTFLIVTPYLGLKALFTKADCSYDWKYETSVNGQSYKILSDGDSNSYKHSISDVGIQTQVFGGFSLNLAVFQTSFNAAYNFSAKLFTGSVGMSIKF